MELRQLRYFLAVSEDLHFGRAARRLNVSQPPLSVAVQQLERELGVQLLDRSRRTIRLTGAGLAVKVRAREILDAVDGLADVATGAFHLGHLRIGFVNSAGLTVLPPALSAFRTAHPQVELTLLELTSAQQIDALHEGTIDVGLIRGADGATALRATPVLEEELVAVLPAQHPLAHHDEVTAADLVAEPLVFVPRRLMPGFFDAVMAVLRAGGGTPRIVQRAVAQETITGLVAAQVGCSVLPASTALLPRPGVVHRFLREHPAAPPLALAVTDDDSDRLVGLFAEQVLLAAAEFVAAQGTTGAGGPYRLP